ncbi:MAG: hypothetical protein M3Q69_20390, partial [Acidobacteriota bacterium]|nr:hypothetical protein [Acidobacteriota bacterium]
FDSVRAAVSGAKAATGVAALQTFPQVEVVDVHFADTITLTIKNNGPVIRTRTYGQPEYRLIAKLFDGETEVQNRWLALPGDLHQTQTATLSFARTANGKTLRLYHALQDVPLVDDTPFAEVRDV